MNEMNNTSSDLRVDLVIDDVVARMAGCAAGEPALTRLSSDEAIIVELSRLGDIDWPADEVGDRIAMSVAAAVGRIRIRVQAFPKSWPATGVAVSCPTGRDCFVETADVNGADYGNNTIEATRDDGHIWTSLGTPMVPAAGWCSPTCTVPAELRARTAALQGHLRCGAVVRGTSGAGSRSRCAPGH